MKKYRKKPVGLAKDLRKKRMLEEVSLRSLGPKIAVSFSTLARFERGEGNLTPQVKQRVEAWVYEGKTFSKKIDWGSISIDSLHKRLLNLEKMLGVKQTYEEVDG